MMSVILDNKHNANLMGLFRKLSDTRECVIYILIHCSRLHLHCHLYQSRARHKNQYSFRRQQQKLVR